LVLLACWGDDCVTAWLVADLVVLHRSDRDLSELRELDRGGNLTVEKHPSFRTYI
jgi:hypothetical protein